MQVLSSLPGLCSRDEIRAVSCPVRRRSCGITRLKSLQGSFAAGCLLGQLDLRHRNQDFSARLKIGCFQQRLLLRAAIGRHHGERVDERLVGRILDALPIGLEIVGLEKIGKRAQQRLSIDLLLTLTRGKVANEWRIGHATLTKWGVYFELLLDAE